MYSENEVNAFPLSLAASFYVEHMSLCTQLSRQRLCVSIILRESLVGILWESTPTLEIRNLETLTTF